MQYLIIGGVLVLVFAGYLYFRLPAAALKFTMVDDSVLQARFSGWKVRQTVTIEAGAHQSTVEFRFWRSRGKLRIRSDVVGSGRTPVYNEYVMPIHRARTTMQAGISIYFEPRHIRRPRLSEQSA